MTTAKSPTAVPQDVEALAPSSDEITLSSGLVVRVTRLKTRGMFRLLKIVTRGAGPIIMQMPLDFNDSEAFMQQLMGVIFMAVPEAEQEAIEFIQSMVLPVAYNEGAKTKAQIDANNALIAQLVADLDDPEIDDTISIIESIVTNEAPHIQALGKRLAAILKTQLGSGLAKN